MANGVHPAVGLEGEHTVDGRRVAQRSAGRVLVRVIQPRFYPLHCDTAPGSGVGHPYLLDGLEVEVTRVAQGGSERQIPRQFERKTDRDIVPEAVVPRFNEGGVHQIILLATDIIPQFGGISDADIVVPFHRAHLILLTERIDLRHAQAKIRQGKGDGGIRAVLAVTKRTTHAERAVRPFLAPGDAGLFPLVHNVVIAGRIVAVIRGRRHIDRRRKRGIGVRLRVLRVRPTHRPVLRLLVIGQSLLADVVLTDVSLELTAELVAFPIGGSRAQRPRTVRINIAGEGEIHVVINIKVISAITQVESAHALLPVRGHDDARRALVGNREKAERNGQRKRNALELKVGRSRDDLFVFNHLGLGHAYAEVGMVVLIASRVHAFLHAIDRVVLLFGDFSLKVPLALLGDDIRDDSFLGVEIIPHLDALESLPVVREVGGAHQFAGGIRRAGGISQLFLHVQLNIVGLQFRGDILHIGVAIEKHLLAVDGKMDGVLRIIGDEVVKQRLGFRRGILRDSVNRHAQRIVDNADTVARLSGCVSRPQRQSGSEQIFGRGTIGRQYNRQGDCYKKDAILHKKPRV